EDHDHLAGPGERGGSRDAALHVLLVPSGERTQAADERSEKPAPEQLVLGHVPKGPGVERIGDGPDVPAGEVVRREDEAAVAREMLRPADLGPEQDADERPVQEGGQPVEAQGLALPTVAVRAYSVGAPQTNQASLRGQQRRQRGADAKPQPLASLLLRAPVG